MLPLILALTVIVYAVDTGAFAARLAGVRTGRLALAGTIYNLLALSSRTANAPKAPLHPIFSPAGDTLVSVKQQDLPLLLDGPPRSVYNTDPHNADVQN
jgi:hypothetical protein